MESAEKIFAEHGFDGAAMDEIAAAAGISKPVLYDHFDSKQALYVAVLKSIREELLDRGARAASTSMPASLAAAIEGFLSFVRERPSAAEVFFVLSRREAVPGGLARTIQTEARAALSKMLSRYVKTDPATIELLTVIIQRGLHEAADWWLQHPEIGQKVVSETISGFFLNGLASVRHRQVGTGRLATADRDR